MKRKQMQLADSRLVLSSGAKLAHCHGQPVGRLTSSAVVQQAPGVLWRLLAVGRSSLHPSFQPFDECHRLLFSWLSERILRYPYG